METRTPAEAGFPFIDWTATFAGRDAAWPRVARASICGLTNADADKESLIGAHLVTTLKGPLLQLSLSVRRTTGFVIALKTEV